MAGTNITVYHTFHDEVQVYKKHVWRCNGICKERKPFFGYVRRVSNRAPGHNDLWWKTHQNDCGGRFEKIGEPDKVKKGKSASGTGVKKPAAKKAIDKNQPRINDVFGGGAGGGGSGSATPAGRGSVPPVIPKYSPPHSLPSRFPGSNIRGFPDLGDSPPPSSGGGGGGSSIAKLPVPLFNGKGNVLTSEKAEKAEKEVFQSIQDQVRNIWQKRYATGGVGPSHAAPPPPKRPRHVPSAVSIERSNQTEPNKTNQWQVLDGDIAIRTPYVPVVDLLDSDSEDESDQELRDHNEILTQMANKTVKERKSLIDQELQDSDDEDEIVRIDDEYDDTLAVGGKNKDTKRVQGDPDEVVKCPICEGGVARSYLMDHMEEGCTGIRQKVPFVMNRADRDIFGPSTSFTTSGPGGSSSSSLSSSSAASAPTAKISPIKEREEEIRYPCPNCNMRYAESRINDHLDQCLS